MHDVTKIYQMGDVQDTERYGSVDPEFTTGSLLQPGNLSFGRDDLTQVPLAAAVAHFAHLGGMLSGFIVLLYWSRYPPGYR